MRRILVLAPLALAVVATALWLNRSPELPIDSGVNVIVVSVDTLRADRLGLLTPNIERFAADSVRFTNAYSSAPSTLPAHAALFTSLLPAHHQALFALRQPLPDSAITLAETLGERGWATSAFTGGGQIEALFGLDQGFQIYESHEVPLAEISRLALDWVDEEARPFLLFLHSYQVHHPYSPQPENLARLNDSYTGDLPWAIDGEVLWKINQGLLTVDDADLTHIEAAYNAEVLEMDMGFGQLIDELQRRQLYDGSLLVLTSDHGEEFSEHGWVGWHGHSLYDELLHVPLVIKFPGGRWAGQRVDTQVRTLDLSPTILAHLGLGSPAQFQGLDLRPLILGRGSDRLVLSSRDQRVPMPDQSLRLGRWKLYTQGDHTRLFDLDADPGERTDVAADHRLRVAWMKRRLARVLDRGPHLDPASPTDVDEQTRQQLEALGYVQ